MVVIQSLLLKAEEAPQHQAQETLSWLHVAFEHRFRVERLTNQFRVYENGATRTVAARTRLRVFLGDI